MFIITTASRLSSNPQILKKMILSGSDIMRFNFSYGTIEEKILSIKKFKQTCVELNANIKILIDLPNPKIRLGGFNLQSVHLEEGEKITLKSKDYSENTNSFFPVKYKNIGEIFYPEQTIIIDEGEIQLKIIKILSQDTVECISLNSGSIYPYKGLTWKEQTYDQTKIIKENGKKILEDIKNLHPEYISCPLVSTSKIADTYNKIIDEINWQKKPRVIFKIGDQKGYNNLDKIINLTDYILIERGNLGINIPYQKTGIYQKEIIKKCKKKKKKVIISTQILESTIDNFIPNRAEISDLTNMVIEKVDGIMLCHETGVSSRPAYSISVAKNIINETEKYLNQQKCQ